MQSVENPETWRKPMSRHSDKSIGEKKPYVDTLHQSREKKWFFDTVENGHDESYFPYGAPGGGAPLRNPENNHIQSKLPHIEENLWKTNNPAPNPITHDLNPPSPTKSILNDKRQQIHQFIDEMTKPKIIHNDFNVNERSNFYTRTKKVKNVDPNHYWNDWFGRPGGGAPSYDTRKQNLESMLEPGLPKNSREGYRPVYDPTASLSK